MAELSTDQIKSQIADLRSQGKTESTSKKLGKLVEHLGSGSKIGEAPKTSTGGSNIGSSSTSSSIGSIDSTVQRAIELNRNAIQPAIQSFESSIPEIQKSFDDRSSQLEAEKTPLTDRFNNLIERVSGSFARNRDAATLTTSNELGRRGIAGSSGVADREMQAAVSPINEQEAQAVTDIGFEREGQLRALQNSISNLLNDRTGALRGVYNQIGGLEAGAGQAGIGQGIELRGQDISSNQFAQNLALQQDAVSKSGQLSPLEQMLQQAQIDFIKAQQAALENGAGGGGGTGSIDDAAANFNGDISSIVNSASTEDLGAGGFFSRLFGTNKDNSISLPGNIPLR